MPTWQSSIWFESLQESDAGVYKCNKLRIGLPAIDSKCATFIFIYLPHYSVFYVEPIEFLEVGNISLANYDHGATVSISCSVASCASDLVLQLFKEDQLVPLKTRRENSTLITGSAQIKATDRVAGVYVYQAMSEKYNEFARKSFSITGKVLAWSVSVECAQDSLLFFLLHRFSQDYLIMFYNVFTVAQL